MTITLDNRPEIPLHPLDLTAEPPQTNQAQYCIGLIQTADSQFSNPANSLGDIILGVPFLRNVYTVMAYTAPGANGSFAPVNGSNQTITPKLGLLSLTNPTIALEEFNTVRVLDQPISGGNSSGGPAGESPTSSTVSLGGKKLSVGIVVLIGIMSFFALCCVVFVARWYMFRRRYRKAAMCGEVFGEKKSPTTEVFVLTKTMSSKDEKSSFVAKSEDTALAVGLKEEEKIVSYSGTNLPIVEYGFGGRERESIVSGDNTLVQPYPTEEADHLHSPLSLSPSQTQESPTFSDPQSPVSFDYESEFQDDLDEDNVRTSMAGIGTASRTSKTYLDSSFLGYMDLSTRTSY
jgi:hypothetical protein